MIGGYVLDPSTIQAFGRGTAAALTVIDELDMAAQAILLPMTALAEALTALHTAEEVDRALVLLEFGAAVKNDLVSANVESIATAHLTARAETTLGMAHAAVAARERLWSVLTDRSEQWAAAHPEIDVARLSA
jgi:hypothetical protein